MKEDYLEKGQCACGNVKYQLNRKPMFVHCCHCTWCQRETGSAFAINALIEKENIQKLEGKPETINLPSNSGLGQVVKRCASCKTNLWSNYGAAKSAVCFVRVGTLCNPDCCPPDIHIFTQTKQEWVNLDGNIPVMNEYYQRSKFWPQESVERYKKALAS